MSANPPDDEGKTIISRRVVPPDKPTDQTQAHRRPPSGPSRGAWSDQGARPPTPPPPPGRPPTTQTPPPKKRGKLRPDQVRYLIVAWFGLSIIIGVCAFAGIYALSTGAGSRFTDATPLGQVPLSTATASAVPSATEDPGTLIPTLIPTEPQAAPTQAETEVGALPPIGSFNLGGQAIHGGIPHADQMHQAGMTWVKLQAYDLSVDFGPAVENAHNLGFRILVSVKDDANKDQVTNPEYQQQFAAYLVTLAEQGADAIEVWNEANIDREWPAGQISGAKYTELLELVYPQIKAANPDTIVISGALSPTGFFGGGCSASGCDDRPFLRAMVNAGALNYADCVGIHYNEGIVPPSQTSGDPRGNSNHYTRYYQSMVDTYLEVTGGLKPLCFTELGFLTDAGYEDLASIAPSFAWAANTTIEQQADWLAEAAALAKDSDGDVWMVMVFNVDFETYGADPQAGFAIIRPGGACPACETLASVMRE